MTLSTVADAEISNSPWVKFQSAGWVNFPSAPTHLNLAYRWFCPLGLEDEVPNHSTFSKYLHGRFRDSDLFRWLFNEVLPRCMAAGLVKGEGFAVDASIIKADASRQRGVVGDEVDWRDPALSTRAVREYLEALDASSNAERQASLGIRAADLS